MLGLGQRAALLRRKLQGLQLTLTLWRVRAHAFASQCFSPLTPTFAQAGLKPLHPPHHPRTPTPPDVTLWNAVTDISATLGLKRPKIDADGSVFWTRNGIMEVACNFEGLEVRGARGRLACASQAAPPAPPAARTPPSPPPASTPAQAYPFGKISCEMEMGSWVMDRGGMDLWMFGDGASLGGSVTGEEGAQNVEYTPLR